MPPRLLIFGDEIVSSGLLMPFIMCAVMIYNVCRYDILIRYSDNESNDRVLCDASSDAERMPSSTAIFL